MAATRDYVPARHEASTYIMSMVSDLIFYAGYEGFPQGRAVFISTGVKTAELNAGDKDTTDDWT